jgi:hypothetical protein
MPTSSQKSTTPAGTLYDHNAIIRPLFYDVNLGIAYDDNAVGNSWGARLCGVAARPQELRDEDGPKGQPAATSHNLSSVWLRGWKLEA